MNNDFERIKQRLSVVDVVSKYINISPNGQNFKAVCPFHKEKSPSLIVSPTKEIWHCFGCGEGGDIFKFVMLYESIEKKEALFILAKQANIELSKLTGTQDNQKTQSNSNEYEIGQKYLNWVSELYHQLLLKIIQNSDNPITKYCLTRGLSEEIIKKFTLGYAPKNDFLVQYSAKNNLSQELLIKVGVLKTNEFNRTKDKFSDRLVIPIKDKKSFVVGFTARTFPFDNVPNRPKYLNSSQSEWFNKSELWFGWDINSQSIRQKNKVIIVEGNMDVIKSYQSGIDYVLASQGTSFTSLQLKSLKSLTKNIQLAFDNDNAGLIAGEKFFVEATKIGFDVSKVVIDPKFKDLDEQLSNGQNQIQTSNYLDFVLNQNYINLQSINSKTQKEAILHFLGILSSCDPISIEQYLNKLSEITKIKQLTLSSFIQNQRKTAYIDDFQNNSKIDLDPEKLIIDILKKLMIFVDLDDSKLAICFDLIKALGKKLYEFKNITDYHNEIKPELDLMLDNIAKNEDDINQWFSIIIGYIDKNVNRILLQNSLKEKYLILKST